jgi:hypothetical protein
MTILGFEVNYWNQRNLNLERLELVLAIESLVESKLFRDDPGNVCSRNLGSIVKFSKRANWCKDTEAMFDICVVRIDNWIMMIYKATDPLIYTNFKANDMIS